jgi:hypothetical protein
MQSELEQFNYSVSQFFHSLRRSVQRHYQNRQLGGESERERYTKSMLLVEEAVIRFGSHHKNGRASMVTVRQAAQLELESFVDRVAKTDLTGVVFDAHIIKGHTHPLERSIVATMRSYLSLEGGDITVGEALTGFRRYVEDFAVGEDAPPVQVPFEDLLRIVPKQQEGPIQFALVNDVITVVRRPPNVDDADRGIVAATAEHIKSSGERLIEEVRNTNCDRRLLQRVQELHARIVENSNIILIGLANDDCSTIAAGLQAELSSVVNAMLVGYHSNISRYVALFPEWQQFVSKADALPLDDTDAATAKEALGKVVRELESHPELAEPEVPKLLRHIREFLSSPGASGKRLVYAIISGTMNLVSIIVHGAMSAFGKTIANAIGVGSAAAVLLYCLSGLAPLSSLGSVPWVKQAIKVLEKEIAKRGGLE